MKRMAVPAALMSISAGMSCKARIITSVSSQSERFRGSMPPPESAWMIRARLLILLEAGSWMLARRLLGGVMV